ncbi:hypothetical protein O3W52_01030 [Ensifer psoraleae]|uniref:Uncharacterized protein n=1 Tax=Sinorhizobium psoraleae TaxID=520838 RepID=A0ABT4K9V8_9HYPH|nr:hypothetical protein [Sinorhizobium psoraleae]
MSNAAGQLGAILAWEVNLGQYFQRTPFSGNDTDNPSRPQPITSVFQNAAPAPASQRRR